MGGRRITIGLAAVLAAPITLTTLGACTTHAAGPTDAGAATVVAVVDGDTVIVRIDGREETVRLLGIDTPETKDPRKPVMCFGAEASARTSALLPRGTAVTLERDVEPRDRYGRLLAYVHRTGDGLFVNVALAREGYARELTIPPNVAYRSDVRAAVKAARVARSGLWGSCGAFGAPVASRP